MIDPIGKVLAASAMLMAEGAPLKNG